MNNIETSNVSFLVSNNSSSAHVTPTGDHDNVTSVEFDKVYNFVLFNVELDSVVYFNQRIRVADGSPIVCDDVWDSASTNGNFADFQKLVGSFLGGDSVNGETALDIIEEAEVFARLLDGNDIHETGRVCGICANLAVNFDESLSDNGGNFMTSQSIF